MKYFLPKSLTFLFLVILLLIHHNLIVAAGMTFNISDAPSNINFSDEFDVYVNFSNAPKNANYYLQIAFTLPDKSAYFGYTQKNDASWHSYEEVFDSFYQITINNEGSWSGKLRGKPDIEDNDFKGSNNYNLRVKRFTASGASYEWSGNTLTTFISGPTPTLTPTPTVMPSPTNVSAANPSNTPVPSSTPKPQSTVTSVFPSLTKFTITITSATFKSSSASNEMEEEVLGIAGADEEVSTESEHGKSNKPSLPLLIFLIAGGFVCFAAAIYLSFKKAKNIS